MFRCETYAHTCHAETCYPKYPVSDMSGSETHHSCSDRVLRPENLIIGMTTALGVGVVVTLVTYLVMNVSTDAAATTQPLKLLIDTDAGADDAIAILMALQAEELNGNATSVVGITCVNGNTHVDNVVMNVLKTLKVVDRLDIPVYKGAHQPLLMNDVKTDYFGKDGFGDFEYPDPPSADLVQENHAVNAMIDLVKANPGELTLLTLGPLTNIALATRIYSSFINDLRQLIILGGSSEVVGNVRPGVEYNFGVDPAANYIVFNASISKPAILVSLETTQRLKTPMTLRTSFNDTSNRKVWLINSAESLTLNTENDYWECADAVAAAVAINSGDIVTKSTSFYMDAVHEGSLTAGMILIDYTNLTLKNPNVNLVQGVDVEVYENMISTLFN